MRSLICTAPGSLQYEEINAPVPGPGRAIIRVKRVGICGTDLHAFEGTQPFFNYPRILGHELAGDLVDADDAPDFVPGETVTIVPYFNCGYCVACRKGKPNCCVNLKVCGVHVDGGMVDYLCVPSSTLLHSEGLEYDELALVEPLAIGAHGIRRAGIEPGEFVLVVGAGPIGLATMEFGRIAGATVIAMDINDSRLQFCRKMLRLANVINPLKSDVMQLLMEITHGDMPGVVIDATGNQQAINNGLTYLAHGGKYVLIGLQKNEIIFNQPEFHKREATLMSSRNAIKDDFRQVIACIKNKLIAPSDYITHRADFGSAIDEFSTWLNPSSGTIKALIQMD